MASVIYHRNGTGDARIGGELEDISLAHICTQFPNNAVRFINAVQVPEVILQGTTPKSANPGTNAVRVFIRVDKSETNSRFNKEGLWLFEALGPEEFHRAVAVESN